MSEGIDIFFRQIIDEDGFAGTGDGLKFPEPVAVARSSRLDIFVGIFLDEKCGECVPTGFGWEPAIPGLVDIAEVVARFGSSEIIDANRIDFFEARWVAQGNVVSRSTYKRATIRRLCALPSALIVIYDECFHTLHILTPVIVGIGDIVIAIL